MNHLWISCFILGTLAIVFADEKRKPKYTTFYDYIDLDAVLKNDRILRNYMDCCLGKRKCTPVGQEMKNHIRNAMNNECDECTLAQKKAMKKIARKIYNDKPELWKELCDHFDPEKKFRTRYQKFIDGALAGKDD